MARVPGGLPFPPVPSDMSRACLTAGILTILAAPVSAQIGLTSTPRSVSLLATRQSSVTVTVPADGVVTTEWNVDSAQPLAMTLRAFVGRPVPVPAELEHLREIVPRVDVHDREREARRAEGRTNCRAGARPRTFSPWW